MNRNKALLVHCFTSCDEMGMQGAAPLDWVLGLRPSALPPLAAEGGQSNEVKQSTIF